MEIKTIKITNNDLLVGESAFNHLAKSKFKDVKHKYWVGKCLRDYRAAIEDYNRARDAVVMEISPKNGQIALNSPEMGKFGQLNKKLLEIEVELKLPFFSLEELPDEVTGEDIASLWFMIGLDDLKEEDLKEKAKGEKELA